MVLLTVLRKIQRKEKQARVLVLGLDNAGKSTLVARALHRSLSDVQPTFGFQIKTVEHGGLYLNIWDVGGQRSLRPFWHNYFEKTDMLVWVVDASAPERLIDCKAELHNALQAEEDRLVGAGLLVWINKIDAVDESPEAVIEDFATKLGISELQKHHNCKLLVCSAYTGEGVERGLDYIADEVRSRLYSL